MYTKIDAWSACSIAMNDYACILIWDFHTRTGDPIRVWANIRIWGRTSPSLIPGFNERKPQSKTFKSSQLLLKLSGRH